MDSKTNLWADVGNACLREARILVSGPTIPTAATVETAKKLVDIAISIDLLNLRWAEYNRHGAAVFPDRTKEGDRGR